MKIKLDFHMIKGDGDSSYAKNSSTQGKAILSTKPMVEKATKEICMDLQPRSMVVADLGCSSGANTLLFISEVIAIISEETPANNNNRECPMEVQFFLNDLPNNDLNHNFQLLEQFKQSIVRDCARRGLQHPPYYVAGVPGSFYTRLFPCNSVHIFHSSFSLMWLSQGRVEKEKLDSFNRPMYGPSVDELKQLVQESQLFDIIDIRAFDLTFDPIDKLELEESATATTGRPYSVHEAIDNNHTTTLRAVTETLLASHFGESIMDDLFTLFACNVTRHLESCAWEESSIMAISVSLDTKVRG
ncbi:Os11g0260100 [Oryza sativa Japonica Group]|uniref:Os11g0260100 protein n=3 Tax=Oryza TaxID=4527 RepID=B9FHS8_ORYSJ|nr:SAM dependent carboxyl methyltransferase [Oryza sativa Japonica Group]EEE63509.1 hypothetical protein OsJ_18325 [Oryza sativa Japonica Group]KAB8114870.1 hypothetical protein EE612_054574 [Oryza sativa]BAF28009.1 Os11g0260100 [Oryza sativa Japonica Group]BAT13493.1 Os11g0260100 [Oryza sativa Japonica Group]|eukprot:NP_001067646.1 Os11g0260100 [Oryza sativa Japonica Group]